MKYEMTAAERKRSYIERMARAREMVAAGMNRESVAIELQIGVSMVNKACSGLQSTYKRPSKRYYHDWLAPDDEANVNGFYVPSPSEIAERARQIRELNGHGDRA